MFTGAELGTILADSGARGWCCATPEFAEAVAGALPLAPEVEHAGPRRRRRPSPCPTPSTLHTWEEFLTAGRAAPDGRRAVADTDRATRGRCGSTPRGTTGLPKAAMHRHANIRHVCETYGAQVLGIRPDDTTFSVAKLFFAYGIGNSVFFPFSVGATTVLEPRRPTPDVVRERRRAGAAHAVLRGARRSTPR